jgi:citrate lyase subunit beta-like protein
LQAIDMVQVNFKDLELVETESRFGSALGFSGKQIIHPAQIAPVQQAFTPSADEIKHALEVVRSSEVFQAQGRGAFAMGELMVDTPVVKRAQNVLARAKAAGVLSQT